MSPKDMAGETVFLQYVAETLAHYPDDGDLQTELTYGTQRAADLLSILGETLGRAGEKDLARTYLQAASDVADLLSTRPAASKDG